MYMLLLQINGNILCFSKFVFLILCYSNFKYYLLKWNLCIEGLSIQCISLGCAILKTFRIKSITIQNRGLFNFIYLFIFIFTYPRVFVQLVFLGL